MPEFDPASRVKELLGDRGDKLPWNTTLSYTWVNGYETFHVDNYHYTGVQHPHGTCEGAGFCIHCGMTMPEERDTW